MPDGIQLAQKIAPRLSHRVSEYYRKLCNLSILLSAYHNEFLDVGCPFGLQNT